MTLDTGDRAIEGASMKQIATILVAVMTIIVVHAATGRVIAETISVKGSSLTGGVDIKVTNVRTGETRTVQSGRDGTVEIRRLDPGIYKIEEVGSEARYIEIKPGAVGTRVELKAESPENVQALVAGLEPNARDSVVKRLDGPGSAADKARAIGEQIKETEDHLKRAIEQNARTPGLIDIQAILNTLNDLEKIRGHYTDEARRLGAPDRRQSAADQPIRQLSPWEQRWQDSFGVFAGVESVDVGRVGLGTVIGGGTERALLKSDDRISGANVGVGFGHRIGDLGWFRNARLVASFNYLDASDSDAADEPIGGRPVAITYHQRAPNNSTGLGLGATGLSARQDVDIAGYRAMVGIASRIALTQSRKTGFRPFVGLKYERMEQEFSGVLRSLTFNDITSTTSQTLTDDYFGPSFGGYFDLKCDDTAFMIGGKIDLLHRWSRFDSVQQNRCGACAAPENAFDAVRSDRDTGFTLGGEFLVGVNHRLLPNLSLGAVTGVRYRDERAVVINPESPAQGTVRFGTDSATDGFIQARARYSF